MPTMQDETLIERYQRDVVTEAHCLLKMLDSECAAHDWYYAYSDDHRVWRKGEDQYRSIKHIIKNLEHLGYAQQAKAVLFKYCEAK